MNQLERNNDETNRPPGPEVGAPGARNLGDLRRRAAALQAVSDATLRNAMSANSQAYNSSMRQEGGE